MRCSSVYQVMQVRRLKDSQQGGGGPLRLYSSSSSTAVYSTKGSEVRGVGQGSRVQGWRNQRSVRSSEVLRGSGGGGTSEELQENISMVPQHVLNMFLCVSRFFFRSGNIEHPGDKLFNTSVEVLPFDVSPTFCHLLLLLDLHLHLQPGVRCQRGGGGQRSKVKLCVCVCAEHPGGEGGADGRSGEDPPVPAH